MSKEKCKDCGEERYIDPWACDGLCVTCRKQENRAKLTEALQNDEETETCWEEEVICPWCGFGHGVSYYDDQSDGGELWCGECGKLFFWEAEIDITYSTQRREEE